MINKKLLVSFIIVISVIVIASFFIPKETKPSADTRIILEHNYKTYIAPQCYQESGASNYIEDGTLKRAQDLNYDPNDLCTEEELKSITDSLFISLLKDIGLLNKKWDNW